MYCCNICNYKTSISSNIKKHNSSQKHIIKSNISVNSANTINNANSINTTNTTNTTNTINNDNTHFICINCNKQYKYINEFKKHCIVCFNEDDCNKDFQHKLEIEKLKNEYEFKIKDLECKIKDLEYKNKDLEYKNLKQILNLHNKIDKIDNIVNTNSNNNNKITNNITNINMPKLDFLNSNFCNVLNIDDFIDNYKNKYCLSKKETQILLENSLMGGLNNCISTLSCYLQRIAHKMYTELKCENLSVDESIMPIVLVDGSLRSHYEKNETQWIRTTSMDKLSSIYNITNDQIYKHHSKYLAYDAYQKKKIQTGILKANNYTRLNNLRNDFYKKKSITNQNANKDDENNNEENIENTEDTKENKNSISSQETNDEFEEESDYGYYGYYDSSDDSDYCHNENNDDD